MGRKKISDYVYYPTSVVDGRKIVGNITKVPVVEDGKITGYQDKMVKGRSPGDTALSKGSPKYKQRSVKQYDPSLLNTRSRVHSKKYGSRYTLILDGSVIYLEISQSGNLDGEVRMLQIGSVDDNRNFIPLDRIVFCDRGYEIGRDLHWIADWLTVPIGTLLKQCKAIGERYDPLEDHQIDNTHATKRKKLAKKTQIR